MPTLSLSSEVLAIPSLEHQKHLGAFLIEIFSSIQGEGLAVGQRHLFLRFLGCHIQCAYCDTPETHTKQRQCRVELTPGQRDFMEVSNPLPIDQILSFIHHLEVFPGLHQAISLTGGEPLQHLKALQALLPSLKPHFNLYLETDGILFQNLKTILPFLDTIAMDLKIPSATQLKPFWEEHRQFIKMAASKNLFVKLVVTSAFLQTELEAVLELIRECDASIPLILQPVTPYGMVKDVPTAYQLLEWHKQACQVLKDVRIIPQMHKLMRHL